MFGRWIVHPRARVIESFTRSSTEGDPREDELHNYIDTVNDLVDPRSAWSRGELPRAVVACESTPTAGGFYMDSAGGPQWETLVASKFPEVMAQRFDIGGSSRAECACRTG